MARPKIPIDENLVQKMASWGCSIEEMADHFGCSRDTIERRFAAKIRKGKADLKTSLRHWQLDAARKGNTTMLIWLGKQHLEQRDRSWQEHSGPEGKPIETKDVTSLSMEQIDTRIQALQKLSPKEEG